jgi:hypothetical protein
MDLVNLLQSAKLPVTRQRRPGHHYERQASVSNKLSAYSDYVTSEDEVGTRFVKLKERKDLSTNSNDGLDINGNRSNDAPNAELRNSDDSNGDGRSGLDVDNDHLDVYDVGDSYSSEPSPS